MPLYNDHGGPGPKTETLFYFIFFFASPGLKIGAFIE